MSDHYCCKRCGQEYRACSCGTGKLTALTAAFEAQFNAIARETALNNPRAMNAWDAAKKAIAALKKAAKTIDDVEAGRR